MRPVLAVWHLVLRRAGLAETTAYIEWMANTFPRPS